MSIEPELITRLKARLEQAGLFWTVCNPMQDGWTLKVADGTTVNVYLSTGKITAQGVGHLQVEKALGIGK